MGLPAGLSTFQRACCYVGLSLPVGVIFYTPILVFFALAALPTSWATLVFATVVLLALTPLPERQSSAVASFFEWLVQTAQAYHAVRVICEDSDLGSGPFVIGLEPHSSIPTAIPVIFNPYSAALPEALRPCHGGATSAMFWFPVIRQFMWCLGIRPVTRQSIRRLLEGGMTICLNPGGIQECLLMERGKEVAFLKARLGFVRLAMQQGAPLIAAFAFGQSDCFHYARPGPPLISARMLELVSRKIGFVPMPLWGRGGTMCPYPARITVVLSKPITVPKVAEPSKAECQIYLDIFIAEMQRIFDKYKEPLGFASTVLEIH